MPHPLGLLLLELVPPGTWFYHSHDRSRLTNRWGTRPKSPSHSPSPGPHLDDLSANIGPALPNPSDRRLAIEAQRELEAATAKAERASTRRQALDRAEEHAPRLGGKEGKMAEKRAVNSANKEMRDKEVGGLEVDEKTLMGEGTSFQAAYVSIPLAVWSRLMYRLKARDAAAARKKDKRDAQMADFRSANEERLAERRQKENDTMSM